MGYNLTIGNARLRYYKEGAHLSIEAEPATHPDAPNHDPYTAKGNGRSPSYTAWSNFCKEAGIYPMFYGAGWSGADRRHVPKDGFYRETPLLANHPGAEPLMPEDFEFVSAARKRREATNGGKPAGFWDEDDVDNGTDPTLARLLWLEFWIGWALENCEIPILENT